MEEEYSQILRVPMKDQWVGSTWKLLSFQPGFLASTFTKRRDCISSLGRPSTNWQRGKKTSNKKYFLVYFTSFKVRNNLIHVHIPPGISHRQPVFLSS